jgi:anti-sigma regulatory factor (Ser/Thr protein kinase)
VCTHGGLTAAGEELAMSARPVAHFAAFYASAAEFITAVRAFAGEGPDESEPVLIVAPGGAISLLCGSLADHGRQVTWADMTWIGTNPARIIPVISAFASSHPGRAVRCVVQPLWDAQTREQLRETIRHEALVNLAFASTQVAILCPYDVGRLDAGIIAAAEQTHPALIRDGAARPSPGYDAGIVFPAGYDAPLDPPPGHAAVLAYRTDLSRVRSFVAEHARKAGAAGRPADDLVIAIGELAANSYRYTSAGGRAAIWADAGELICQVQDTGHITDLLAGRRRPAPGDGAGHGLWLVHQLCDLVEIRTGPAGTQIRVHLQLRSATPETPRGTA